MEISKNDVKCVSWEQNYYRDILSRSLSTHLILRYSLG